MIEDALSDLDALHWALSISFLGAFVWAFYLYFRRTPSTISKGETIDEAKFGTQKMATYLLLGIFSGVTATVLSQNDQSERSTILQTVINITLLVVGYWFGASKGAADSISTIGKIAESAAPAQALAVAAARGPAPLEPVSPSLVTPAPMNPATGNIPAAEAATDPIKEREAVTYTEKPKG